MSDRNIFLSMVVRITFCLTLISWHSGNNALLPQPGQNIRSVCALIGTEVDALLGTFTVLNADFNATFTAIAAITTLINQDFNFTMTAIAGVSSLITTDFNSTFTALAALGACAPIALSQATVNSGQGILLTTTGASYCLSQNITGSIIISASDVTVDLNTYSLIGTIDILSTAINATIQNGKVKPVAPTNSTDAVHAAIVVGSTQNVLIENCYIVCSDSTNSNVNLGRDGINNSGSNTIIDSCFIQAGNGALSGAGGNGISNSGANIQVTKNTVLVGSNGSSFPLSLFTYVANQSDSTVQGYTINPSTGALTSIGTVGTATFPTAIAITSDGTKLYVVKQSTGNIQGYTINPSTGALTSTGTISSGGGTKSIAITPDGTRLYTTNQNAGNVAGFTINPSTGALTSTGTTGSIANPSGIAITPDGTKLYIISGVATSVQGFTINSSTGALTSTGTIGSLGGFPQGIAITPNGGTLYVASTNMYAFTINPSTGALTSVGGSPFSTGQGGGAGVVINPAGNKLYVAVSTGVVGFTINSSSGALALLSGSPFAAGTNPTGIAMTADGSAVYVTNNNGGGSGNISGYIVNTNTGFLTQVSGSPFPAGTSPSGIAITPLVLGGPSGIVQQGVNGIFTNNTILGAGGNGILMATGSNLNIIQDCVVSNNNIGFSMLTAGQVNLLECIANYNTSHGFDLSNSFGKGLVKACVSSQNIGCGFNDRVASLYQYIGNSAQGNGNTPAIPTGDSNYCDSSVTSTFVTPSGPGFAPWYQNARRTDETFNGTSNWDNITLN